MRKNAKSTFNFEEDGIPPTKKGQPLLLSLMLRNLIDNAIRYCPEGSRIKVQLKKHKISVEDNGGGVEEADLAKLGQRFYRPAGQNEKGSGLGLSITHRIAELHHYKVRLKKYDGFERCQNRITGGDFFVIHVIKRSRNNAAFYF